MGFFLKGLIVEKKLYICVTSGISLSEGGNYMKPVQQGIEYLPLPPYLPTLHHVCSGIDNPLHKHSSLILT